MTAEHDGRAEHAGMDALMAAIIDEPLSDDARADAAFMAEHRSAEADLALLREQLGIIGHVLGDPEGAAEAAEPVPVRPFRPRRRALNLAFGTLAVAAVAAVLSGMAWLLAQAGGGMGGADSGSDSAASKTSSEGGSTFGSPDYFACSRLIAEGRATSVEQLPGTESIRVIVDVTRSYKPAKPGADDKKELTYVIDRNIVPGLREGDQVLFAIPNGERQPAYWLVGEKEIARNRARLSVSAAESRGLTCE
ncbi:hypothetical protein ACFYO2_28290 [Streptomyces sp. NPDC006602]|uniref:hypothetical protein n=1 Tax=Streptomyces sp. NPDC006602 TaxID=3364751 RepID=UPI003687FAFA